MVQNNHCSKDSALHRSNQKLKSPLQLTGLLKLTLTTHDGEGQVGGVLLDGLPGLLLEAAMDGLSDGGLHQVDVAHHQGDEQVLQVFVERPVAEVSCGGRGQKKTR